MHLSVGLRWVVCAGSLVFAPSCLGALRGGGSDASSSTGSGSEFTETGARRTCTINGELDSRCLEVTGFASTENPSHERSAEDRTEILDCYAGVKRAFDIVSDEIQWHQLRPVYDHMGRAKKSASLSSDPASVQCLALADKHTGGRFSLAAALQSEKSRLRSVVGETFATTCKLESASVHENELGEPLKVNLPVRPKKPSSKVAIDNADPSYQVLCTGEVVVTTPDGPWRITASYSDETAGANQAGCFNTCVLAYDNKDVCGKGASDPTCKTYCENHCR